MDGIVDHTGNDVGIAICFALLKRNRNAEIRYGMYKVAGAIQRVNDEAVHTIFACDLATFFHQKPKVRACNGKLFVEQFLSACICVGHKGGCPFA